MLLIFGYHASNPILHHYDFLAVMRLRLHQLCLELFILSVSVSKLTQILLFLCVAGALAHMSQVVEFSLEIA